MNLIIFKRIMTLTCLAVIMTVFTACGGGQTTDIAVNEPVAQPEESVPTEESVLTDEETIPTEENISTEETIPAEETILTLEQAQALVQESFPSHEIITHNSEHDRVLEGVLQYFFEISYSDVSGITDVAWIDSETGELETLSSVDFFFDDDWFEDYDPYWAYRIEGLDPFEDDNWVDSPLTDNPLVGSWRLQWNTADHYFPANDLTLELFASHWGQVSVDDVDTVNEFMWTIHYDGEYPSIELEGYWDGTHVQLQIITGLDGGNVLELRNWRTHHVYVFSRIG